MVLILILILTEILIYVVLRQHYLPVSVTVYNISVIFNIVLSIWLWILFISYESFRSFYDSPGHIWLQLALSGAFCAVVIPRILIIFFHYTGITFSRKGHLGWLTNTGVALGFFVFAAVLTGTLNGRFNFRYEQVTIPVNGLNEDLDGLTIVHISDLHLAGFFHHQEELVKVMKKINDYAPDIIVNTGDFVTFGWREFGRNDSILSIARAKYSKYAVIGNHDAGNYHPDFTEADKVNNELNISRLVSNSGYILLRNETKVLNIGKSKLRVVGVTTGGRHPDITHGNIDSALPDTGNVDFTILLTHDPNQWLEDVAGKRINIDLTLSGHTHGMQIGINTRKIRWSPIKYFYPNWNGLYNKDSQYHYVNRGLGTLAVPFRIWMPPEVTIITLVNK